VHGSKSYATLNAKQVKVGNKINKKFEIIIYIYIIFLSICKDLIHFIWISDGKIMKLLVLWANFRKLLTILLTMCKKCF